MKRLVGSLIAGTCALVGLAANPAGADVTVSYSVGVTVNGDPVVQESGTQTVDTDLPPVATP